MREEGRDLTREVIGVAIEVHRILGPGFLESIYEGAMAVELKLKEISFERYMKRKSSPISKRRIAPSPS